MRCSSAMSNWRGNRSCGHRAAGTEIWKYTSKDVMTFKTIKANIVFGLILHWQYHLGEKKHFVQIVDIFANCRGRWKMCNLLCGFCNLASPSIPHHNWHWLALKLWHASQFDIQSLLKVFEGWICLRFRYSIIVKSLDFDIQPLLNVEILILIHCWMLCIQGWIWTKFSQTGFQDLKI